MPGFTGSKEDFIAVLPLLRDMGYTAATYDHRGQYESPGPADPSAYELVHFAEDAVRVSRELSASTGTPVQLVGHSFGGLVAREAVIREALSSSNASDETALFGSLLLMSSGPATVPGELQEMAARLIEAIPNVPLPEIWDLKEAQDRANGWVPPDETIYNFLRTRFISNDPIALAAKAQILISTTDAVDALRAAADTIGLPMMVAYGDLDNRWTPAEQFVMAQRLAARRLLFTGVAHSPNSESPAQCAAAIEGFVSDVNQDIPFAPAVAGYNHGMELWAPVKHSPAAVGEARRMVGRQLRAWGLPDTVDDAELLASELITNAVRYGRSPVELRLIAYSDSVRLEVRDANTVDVPTQRQAGDTQSHGRGLPLIDAVARDWGVSVDSGSKTVWAVLATNLADNGGD